MKVVKGERYYKFLNEEDYEEIRIKSTRGKSIKVIKDGVEKEMDEKVILDDYIRLIPEAMLSISIVEADKLKDVMIAVHKLGDNGVIPKTPTLIARQNVIDPFMDVQSHIRAGNFNKLPIGFSSLVANLPEGVKLESYMAYDELITMDIGYTYLEDTIDDIIELFESNKVKNAFLSTYAFYDKNKDKVDGHSKTFREFLEKNKFISDYHAMFDIFELPFSIRDQDLVPKQALLEIVADIRHVVPSMIIVIPYNKEIDVTEFEKPFIYATADPDRAAEDDRAIYIVGYEDSGQDYADWKYGGKNKMAEKLTELGFN